MGYIILAYVVFYVILRFIKRNNSNTEKLLPQTIPEKSFEDSWLLEFWNETQYYPSWIKNDSINLWPKITEATNISKDRLDLRLKNNNLFSIVKSKDFDGNQVEIEIYFNKDIVCSFIANYILSTESNVDWFELAELKFKKNGEWQNFIREFKKWEENNSKISTLTESDEPKVQMNKKLE